MNSESNTFNTYVVRSVLAKNEFGITEVNDIESLSSRYFLQKEYSRIVQLIKNTNIDAIRTLPTNTNEASTFPREYLDLLMFKDQNNKRYIVTVYDSDELLQDPQVIEIFQVK